MSTSDFTYICCSAKKSQILYFSDVTLSTSTKAISIPKDPSKPTASGQAMEAWSDLKKPVDGTVEGGLYKCVFSGGGPGSNQTLYWIIDADGRSKDANTRVGNAVVIKATGSVLNPAPTVVPVFVADGAAMGDGKRTYYFQNSTKNTKSSSGLIDRTDLDA